MMLAEIIGPPGVGKSTLLAEIDLVFKGSALRTMAVPCVDAEWAREFSDDEEWLAAVHVTLCRSTGIRASGAGWALEDHGIIQRSLQLGVLGGDVHKWLTMVPMPDIVFGCLAPVDIIRQRNIDRAALGRKKDTSATTPAACAMTELVMTAVEERGVTVVRLDTVDAVLQNTSIISTALE